MGPRTLLTLDDLLPVLAQYPLRPLGLAPLGRGTVNSNYRLDTDVGPLFLRVNEGKGEREARYEAALIWHLGTAGVRTPQLWRTRRGAPFVCLPGKGDEPPKPVMLMQWVEGVEITEEGVDEAVAREVGANLARLHLAGQGFGERREGIYTLRHIAGRIQRLHAEPRLPDGIVEFLAREAERLAGARRRDLPVGVGHNDLFPDNVLFDGRRRPRLRAILDLEQAAQLPYAYDVAVALLSFCAAPRVASGAGERVGPLRRDESRALLAGYEEVRPLLLPEREGLYEELRFAALRFTTTRLTDIYLRPPGPRPVGEGEPLAHSKDYRDFLRRLEALQEVGAGGLTRALFD